MATIREDQTPVYPEEIYGIETQDKVIGGPDGIANKQAAQLAARTAWLKQQIADVMSKLPNAVPAGTIVNWYGAMDNIPTGWALCDGQNGTPNLPGKFIVAAGGRDGDPAPGATGGTNEITPAGDVTLEIKTGGGHSHQSNLKVNPHTLSERQLAIHRHYGNIRGPRGAAGNVQIFVTMDPKDPPLYTAYTGGGQAHDHSISGSISEGGSHTHSGSGTFAGEKQDNRPGFYALAFIMKL
jgi:hypothetical protein